MITFVCVLKSGGIYTAEWVRKLSRGVAEHYDAHHRFVCLSDVPVPCERIQLATGSQGWWAKAEAFRHDLGPVVYIDLDSIIVGDLTPLANACQGLPLTLIHDLYQPDKLASGVMLWDGPQMDAYEATRDPGPRKQRMDLKLRTVVPRDRPTVQDLVPGSVESIKRKAKYGPPDGCIIACAHGRDKWVTPWAREHWEAL